VCVHIVLSEDGLVGVKRRLTGWGKEETELNIPLPLFVYQMQAVCNVTITS